MNARWARIVPAVLAAALLGGCATLPPQVPVERLVAEHNSNAERVPRLWARVRMSVTLENDDGWAFTWGSASPLAAPNGLLLLGKGQRPAGPHDFVLIGREIAGVELFRLGSSAEQGVYYFWHTLRGGGEAYWGRQELAGAPRIEGLPFDPNQLLAVLTVSELPRDLSKLPSVALTMSRDPQAYVLTYVDRLPASGRIGFRRRMYFRWADGEPRRPFRVEFLSPDGRVVMRAELSDYAPVAGPVGGGEPEEAVDPADAWLGGENLDAIDEEPAPEPSADEANRPVMATHIVIERVDWPPERGPEGEPAPRSHNPVRRIELRLSDGTTEDRWDRDACRFEPPAGRVMQVDRGIQPGQPEKGRQ